MTAKKPKIYLEVIKGLKNNQIIPQKQPDGIKPLKPMTYQQLIETEEILQKKIQSFR